MACNCENEEQKDVPYFVFEYVRAGYERTVKRFIIALVIAILAMFTTNAAWLYAWCQYDYYSEETTTETTIELDGGDGGNANYIGNDGDIYNGTDTSKNKNPNAETQTD